jgi:AbrB family looped-hinge helix DNA binding protein
MEGMFYDTVTVGERGQVVIPAKARKELGIKAKDKLIVLRAPGKAGIVLVHARHMASMFEKMTRHIAKFKEILKK